MIYNSPSDEKNNVDPPETNLKYLEKLDAPQDLKVSLEDTNDNIDMFIKNTTDDIVSLFNQDDNECFKMLGDGGNYYTTGERRILFKVYKNKFNYPAPKPTTLHFYPNLQVLESLENTEEFKIRKSSTTIACNGENVEIPIDIEYKLVTFRPYVSFSVALYRKKTTDNLPGACEFDINNLDIYALENDSLFLNHFEMCFSKHIPKFDPSQFLVTVNIVDPIGGVVDYVCEFEDYYLYEVKVEIILKLAPAINLDTIINQDTLDVLNAALNKDAGNTLFTKLELDSFIEIDFSNLLTLDYNIFKYLINLIKLDISNTNANTNDNISKLNTLNSLEILIARNNNFNALSQFLSLTNLVNTLKELYLGNDLEPVNSFSVQSYLDISPLAIFINLDILSLSNNNISTVPSDLSYLTTLTLLPTLVNLDLSNNNIEVIPESISNLQSLNSLNLEKNNISDMSNLSSLSNLENLIMKDNPVYQSTIPYIPSIVFLDLSNTELDNDGLLNLNISDSLETLLISNNSISDLTPLYLYNLELNANDQNIFYGTLYPDQESSSLEFFLDLEFLKDIDYSTPCVGFISNGGTCYNGDSCDCVIIVWDNITEVTEVYFEFSNINGNFSGVVKLKLDPFILPI